MRLRLLLIDCQRIRERVSQHVAGVPHDVQGGVQADVQLPTVL